MISFADAPHLSFSRARRRNAPGAFIANIEDNATIASILTAPPPEPGAARGGARGAGPGRGGGGRGGGAQAHAPAYWIKVSAREDGSFTVTNARNGITKTYGGSR